MHMKSVPACALAALLASAGCRADSPFLMPEHSSEFAVGAAWVYREEDQGSARRAAFLQPHFQGEWSNGVFVNGLWLGRQLSSTPHLRYGPMLSLGRVRTSQDGSDGRLRPVIGAFWEYQVLHNLAIRTHGLRMAGKHGGSLLDVQLASANSVAPHQTLGVTAGLRLADRRYLQARFGVGEGASGGVKDVYVGSFWEWDLNTRYTVRAALDYARLEGSAAASPWTARRNSLASSVRLTYRY